MINGYINLKEHFELSDEEKVNRGRIALLMSYDDKMFNSVREEICKKYKVKTTYKNLCFGQVIIVEQILSSQLAEYEKIAMCLSIIYRPIEEKEFDNEDNDKEESIKSNWMSIPAGLALSLFEEIMSYRNDFFYKQYNGVVYKKSDNSIVADEEPHVETFEDVFYRNFGWYERARSIAKELNMSIQQVNMMNANEAMFELAYQLSKSKLTEYREKNKRK